MENNELRDRITYQDKRIVILDVIDGEGKVHARLTIVKNGFGREIHRFNEVYPGGGIDDPVGVKDEQDDED